MAKITIFTNQLRPRGPKTATGTIVVKLLNSIDPWTIFIDGQLTKRARTWQEMDEYIRRWVDNHLTKTWWINKIS